MLHTAIRLPGTSGFPTHRVWVKGNIPLPLSSQTPSSQRRKAKLDTKRSLCLKTYCLNLVEFFERNQWKKWIDWVARISGTQRQLLLARDDLTNFRDFNAALLCDLSDICYRDLCYVCVIYISEQISWWWWQWFWWLSVLCSDPCSANTLFLLPYFVIKKTQANALCSTG